MKKCSACKQEKDTDEFSKDVSRIDGLSHRCKACVSLKNRIYGKKKQDEKMNQTRFEAVQRGLTAQARKVFDSIPVRDSWNPSQVMQDLRRRNISMSDMHVVMGCINSLIGAGLVAEPSKGVFKREEIRPKQPAKDQLFEEVETEKEPEMKSVAPILTSTPITAPIGPLDRLSAFATRLRELATDMEDAALQLAGQAEKNEAETAKMRQLQALLKSLG